MAANLAQVIIFLCTSLTESIDRHFCVRVAFFLDVQNLQLNSQLSSQEEYPGCANCFWGSEVIGVNHRFSRNIGRISIL